MITRVVMPKYTEAMTQSVILTWKMDEGQAVVPGDILAEIETDTAVMELEANGSGFLRHILINEGTSVKTGTVVAVIGDLDDDIGPTLKESIKLQKMAKIDPKTPRMTSLPKNRPHPRKEEAASARKARTFTPPPSSSLPEKETVKVQSGEGNRSLSPQLREQVVEQKRQKTDIEEATPVVEEVLEVVEEILEETGVPVSENEGGLSETSPLDPSSAPHFHLTTEISMAEAERLREQMMDIQQITLSFTTLYVRAAALAFSRQPEFQTSCLGYEKEMIDIGIAITEEDRLLTPLIKNCGRKNIAELSDEIQETTQQTRANQCISEEDSTVSFSIVNFGMYPIEQFIPILPSSRVASLAIGAIRSVQIPEDGIVTVDRRMTVSLSCDYTSIDEDQAAKFLRTFKQILERPLEIFLPNPVE